MTGEEIVARELATGAPIVYRWDAASGKATHISG
jgi:bisphosphoglycerate-dependent phosphoglycerate mutase